MRYDDHLEIERAMVIYAHPDDAEFGVSGTVAKWARDGVEVTYCMITNGASGSQDETMTREELARIREAEQREAAAILGVRNCVFLGYEDGYLEPTLDVRRSVAREIRRYRPDVIMSMDPRVRIESGVYVNHPDHIAAGEVVMRSINPDASTRLMFPELWKDEGLEPWKPKALFLMAFSEGDTLSDITSTMDLKCKALLAHASQVGDWPVEEFIRERNRQLGEPAGYAFAEAFNLIRLEM